MLAALLRYPRSERRAVARDWGRRSQVAQAAKRMERGPNAETVRRRALHDARGDVIREGITYRGDGRIIPWCVRRALGGRVNQVEIVVDGRVWRTGGARRIAALLRA
jgi:hypothetical protein